MLYLFSVVGGALIIALANFFAEGVYVFSAFAEILLFTVLGVVAVVVIDGLFAFLIRRMPERMFKPEAKLFSVGRREKNFYRRIKINWWKRFVPEWGCFTGFHKDKMKSHSDKEYLGRFLLESNYGVAGHVVGALLGFLIMLLPFLKPLSVALPIAVINMILNLLPTMILRANTPALRRLYRRSVEREERKIKASQI